MSILSFPAIHCHGSNNQFILIDEYGFAQNTINNQLRSLITQILCDAKKAFSVDGILFCNQHDFAKYYSLSKNYDSTMRMFNPDGSEAEMCGNGLRCAGRYNIEKANTSQSYIATLKEVLCVSKTHDIFPAITGYDSEIGPLTWNIQSLQIPHREQGETFIHQPLPLLDNVLDSSIRYTALSIPNPHFIGISPVRLTQDRIVEAWEILSKSGLFPEGINLSIVNKLEKNQHAARIFVITCERGVGPTDACGTAMAASASVVDRCTDWCDAEEVIEVFNLGGMVLCDTHSQSVEKKVRLRGNATWIRELDVQVDINTHELKYTVTKEFAQETSNYHKLKTYAQQTIG